MLLLRACIKTHDLPSLLRLEWSSAHLNTLHAMFVGDGEHQKSVEITDSLFRVCVQGTPQNTSRLMGRLAASSTALSKQAITPAVPQTPDQMRQPFFMSATPSGEQQEHAMRQVLQEQVLIAPNQSL